MDAKGSEATLTAPHALPVFDACAGCPWSDGVLPGTASVLPQFYALRRSDPATSMGWAEEFSSAMGRWCLLANLPQHNFVPDLCCAHAGHVAARTGNSCEPKAARHPLVSGGILHPG